MHCTLYLFPALVRDNMADTTCGKCLSAHSKDSVE